MTRQKIEDDRRAVVIEQYSIDDVPRSVTDSEVLRLWEKTKSKATEWYPEFNHFPILFLRRIEELT